MTEISENNRIERDSGKAAADGVLTGAVHPSRWALEAFYSFIHMVRLAMKRGNESEFWGTLSLVFGILSLITCGTLGLPALVCGVTGLYRDTKKGLSIAALAVTVLTTSFSAPILFRILIPRQTKIPLPYEKASKLRYIDHPLPTTASNVWVYYEWGPTTHDFRLRFEAPHSDCLTYTGMLMSKHAGTAWGKSKAYRLLREDGTYYTDRLFDKLPWWDIHLVRRGVMYQYDHLGSVERRAPYNAASIIIDEDRQILYYQTTD